MPEKEDCDVDAVKSNIRRDLTVLANVANQLTRKENLLGRLLKDGKNGTDRVEDFAYALRIYSDDGIKRFRDLYDAVKANLGQEVLVVRENHSQRDQYRCLEGTHLVRGRNLFDHATEYHVQYGVISDALELMAASGEIVIPTAGVHVNLTGESFMNMSFLADPKIKRVDGNISNRVFELPHLTQLAPEDKTGISQLLFSVFRGGYVGSKSEILFGKEVSDRLGSIKSKQDIYESMKSALGTA